MDWVLLAWVLAAALLGAVAAWQVRPWPRAPASREERLTATWSLAELARPLVVARDVDVEVPAGARLVVAGTVTGQAYAAAQVRQVPDVPGEYALDAARGKALLFLGGVRSGTLALASRDAVLVARLAAEAEALWQRGAPYVEALPLADAARRLGVPLAVQGLVTEVLPRQGAFLMRLEDQGQSLGVRVQVDASELKGQRILVQGQMQRDGGYPVLVASDVRRLE